jgi:hypothetical protein
MIVCIHTVPSRGTATDGEVRGGRHLVAVDLAGARSVDLYVARDLFQAL